MKRLVEEPYQQVKKSKQSQLNKNWIEDGYKDFKDRMCMKYLISIDASDFDTMAKEFGMIPGNSSLGQIMSIQTLAYLCACLIYPTTYYCTRTIFQVQANHFALVEQQSIEGRHTVIYGPGYHVIGYFNRLQAIYSFSDQYKNGIIESDIGDLKIIKVIQGTMMHLDSGGNNIILGPGIHLVRDPMRFIKIVSLNSFFIEIGPENWVTVPTGYEGISIDRGQIKILEGGKLHHLPHVAEKFAKMVPKTLQTDRIPSDIPQYIDKLKREKVLTDVQGLDLSHYLQATTIEGAAIHLDAMIFWRIVNTELAAKTAMTFLQVNDIQPGSNANNRSHIQSASEDIADLRANVLRISKNHLCTLVGNCSLASKTSFQLQVKEKNVNELQQGNNQNFQILNYLQDQCTTVKDEINEDTKKIGVILDNICIFSVIPNVGIQKELDKQTKAKVDANTAIVQAKSQQQSSAIQIQSQNLNKLNAALNNANITKLKAQSESMAEITRSEGQSKAIIQVAEARKKEAEELKSQQISQDLARIRVLGETGEIVFQGKSNNFVFGNNPGDVLHKMFQNQIQK